MRLAFYLFAAVCLLAAGCVDPPTVGTNSVLSAADIPAGRYRNVVVFVENIDQADQLAAEESIAARLKRGGVKASSSLEAFNYSRVLGDVEKAALLRDKQFDAALFITLVRRELVAELVPGVFYSDGMFHGTHALGTWSASEELTGYSLDDQGRVVRAAVIVVTQAALQDVRTAKQVWAAETSARVNAKFGNAGDLFDKASSQIVDKLRADRVI